MSRVWLSGKSLPSLAAAGPLLRRYHLAWAIDESNRFGRRAGLFFRGMVSGKLLERTCLHCLIVEGDV